MVQIPALCGYLSNSARATYSSSYVFAGMAVSDCHGIKAPASGARSQFRPGDHGGYLLSEEGRHGDIIFACYVDRHGMHSVALDELVTHAFRSVLVF